MGMIDFGEGVQHKPTSFFW